MSAFSHTMQWILKDPLPIATHSSCMLISVPNCGKLTLVGKAVMSTITSVNPEGHPSSSRSDRIRPGSTRLPFSFRIGISLRRKAFANRFRIVSSFRKASSLRRRSGLSSGFVNRIKQQVGKRKTRQSYLGRSFRGTRVETAACDVRPWRPESVSLASSVQKFLNSPPPQRNPGSHLMPC